jgi:hypothetical protein
MLFCCENLDGDRSVKSGVAGCLAVLDGLE